MVTQLVVSRGRVGMPAERGICVRGGWVCMCACGVLRGGQDAVLLRPHEPTGLNRRLLRDQGGCRSARPHVGQLEGHRSPAVGQNARRTSVGRPSWRTGLLEGPHGERVRCLFRPLARAGAAAGRMGLPEGRASVSPLASRLGAVWREGGRWSAGCLRMGDSGQLGETARWLLARGRHALGRGRGQAEERARKERGSDRREMARLRKRAGRRAAAGCTEWARGTGHEGGGERDAGEGREAMRDVGGGRC